jgi:hypothetical protein
VHQEKPRTSAPLAKQKGTSDGRSPRTLKSVPKNYRNDPLFPRIERAVLAIIATKNFVAPVEMLVSMGVLRAEDVEDWRFGRIPYLERVTQGNLSKMKRILRLLGFLCQDLNLGPSMTAYVRWGKGPRNPLRFTKFSEPRLERAYAQHFVWRGETPFRLPEGYEVSRKTAKAKPRSKDEQTPKAKPGSKDEQTPPKDVLEQFLSGGSETFEGWRSK